MEMYPEATNIPGVLHYIPPNVSAFEPTKPLVRSAKINTLVWVGGMFDTLGSVSYPFEIAQSLGLEWSLVTCSLSSAGFSWGVNSIATDAEDMRKIIAYLKERRPGGKIVIMGHSTGCQDCMEYLVGANAEKRPEVDGIILQAPVSDRESIEDELPEAFRREADQLALKMCREGQDRDALPNRLTRPVFGRLAITARRWVDVSSPGPNHDGADDYFSSDLPTERLKKTFGRLTSRTPLLILYSGDDDSVPKSVDKQKLVQSWMQVVKDAGGAVDESNGGVVPKATHNYNENPEDVRNDLIKRVVSFIGRIDAAEFGTIGSAPRI
ncbi:Hypothetical predicted protein [Lecanosticta acicola]|uniref:DUF1749-domain-containing protein n=1 Tax=Lecanosticta acicola TaxID=111012 RepID=A0AAI8Z068_9PEZI|nr:Hypothetical predicted protein [Lecanosticta acicola]